MKRILGVSLLCAIACILMMVTMVQIFGFTTSQQMSGYYKHVVQRSATGMVYFPSKASGALAGSSTNHVAASYVNIGQCYGAIGTNVVRLYSNDFPGGYADVVVGPVIYEYEGGITGIDSLDVTTLAPGAQLQIEAAW